MDKNSVTVGDLFCGAGGFSEGFRQAGFNIVWAVDNWRPAVETYRNNFSNTKVIEENLSTFDFQRLEPVDVIIGGPPCTFFSLANKAGNGNKIAGLALVRRFVEAVEILKPKYWIMENVANILPAIENGFADAEYLSQRTLINAADYGVPQSRRRLFSGKFPVPLPIANDPAQWIPMSQIVNGLPCPLSKPAIDDATLVHDPLYDCEIQLHALRDHFMNTALTEAQIDACIRGRTHHPWAGPMRFPDSPERPSRTILATTPKGNRGAIVLEEKRVTPKVYRTPTVREASCLQGFPVTFQFWGGSADRNHELIGNAVPPPVARAIANAILGDLGQVSNFVPKFELPQELPAIYSGSANQRPFRLTRPYREVLPGTVRHQCSVNLDNRGKTPATHPGFGVPHLVEWRTTLYVGYATEVVGFQIDLDTAWKLAFLVANFVEGGPDLVERITTYAAKEFASSIPDASSLQAVWARRFRSTFTPDSIVERVIALCKDVLGNKSDRLYSVEARKCYPLLKEHRFYEGKNFSSGNWKKRRVPFYAACAMVGLSIAVAFVNEGATWLMSNWNRCYKGEPFGPQETSLMGTSGVTASSILKSFRRISESSEASDKESMLSFLPYVS